MGELWDINLRGRECESLYNCRFEANSHGQRVIYLEEKTVTHQGTASKQHMLGVQPFFLK